MAACPYCAGAPRRPAYPYATRWQGQNFAYHDCARCGATFIDPLPSARLLDSLFDRNAFHELYYADPEPTADQRASWKWMRPFLPSHAKLLDFGCANGAFMKLAAADGCSVQGVEQNLSSIAFARESSGFEVTSLDSLLAGDARFDVIHVADVLSHLPDPAGLLHALESRLLPGGLMVIEGPLEKQRNLVFLALLTGKRLQRLLGRSREGEHPPVHLTFSTWKSQSYFFSEVMGYQQLALDLHDDGWPFPAELAPSAGIGGRAKWLIAKAAIGLSKSPVARPLGAYSRFRAILRRGSSPTRPQQASAITLN